MQFHIAIPNQSADIDEIAFVQELKAYVSLPEDFYDWETGQIKIELSVYGGTPADSHKLALALKRCVQAFGSWDEDIPFDAPVITIGRQENEEKGSH